MVYPMDDIALTMYPGVSCQTVIHLLECFGSAEQVFAATAQELIDRAELTPVLAESISRKAHHDRVAKELAFIQKYKIRAIDSASEEYPKRLKECPDYPHILYVLGEIDLNRTHWLSIVGTRDNTPYGTRMCEKIVGEIAALCPDVVIVSGLAYGIDISAQRAAMNSGLVTVGVVAHALNRIYPTTHSASARQMIVKGGAVVSEFHSGCKLERPCFIQRNRIIAGLSEGTIIVESAVRGGSLTTADMADGYHRTVMAVPGRVDDPCSEGTNNLIKTLKAQMVCSGEDVVNLLNWQPVASVKSVQTPKVDLTTPQGKLLKWIDKDTPISLEELSRQSGIPPQELCELVLDLELAGAIRTLRGSYYVKC